MAGTIINPKKQNDMKEVEELKKTCEKINDEISKGKEALRRMEELKYDFDELVEEIKEKIEHCMSLVEEMKCTIAYM